MIEENIRGLDFDPLGTSAATIDGYGVCLISDIDTNNYNTHTKVGKTFGDLFRYSKEKIKID